MEGKKSYIRTKEDLVVLKWIILACWSILFFAPNYIYDTPQAVKDILRLHFSTKLNTKQFEVSFAWLYSGYALVNIFLPFLIGYLMEKKVRTEMKWFNLKIVEIHFIYFGNPDRDWTSDDWTRLQIHFNHSNDLWKNNFWNGLGIFEQSFILDNYTLFSVQVHCLCNGKSAFTNE